MMIELMEINVKLNEDEERLIFGMCEHYNRTPEELVKNALSIMYTISKRDPEAHYIRTMGKNILIPILREKVV